MVPATREPNADMVSILNAIASCAEFPLDGKKFAESEGIARSDNAVTKFKRILERNGFTYNKDKKVVKIEGNGSGDVATTMTPKKAATPRISRAKATPAQKKRKLEDDGHAGEGDEEGTEATGGVKNKKASGEFENEDRGPHDH